MIWWMVYRLMGGAHPEDTDLRPGWQSKPLPFSTRAASWLLKHGFLRRDGRLTGLEQSAFINMRWQWRFWRGPYWDAFNQLYRDGRIKSVPTLKEQRAIAREHS